MVTQKQLTQKRGHIAIIALQPKPAAPADLRPTHLQGWIHDLTQLGWQVDVFRQQPAIAPPEHETMGDGWRTVYLDAPSAGETATSEMLPHLLKAFMHYQSKTGILYPLIHTHAWLSGWMGLALKEKQLIKLIHTPDSFSNAHPESTPLVTRMRRVTEQTCHVQADQVVYLGQPHFGEPHHDPYPGYSKGAIAHSAQELDQIYLTALHQLYQEFFAVG